jgi:hypothetical protein
MGVVKIYTSPGGIELLFNQSDCDNYCRGHQPQVYPDLETRHFGKIHTCYTAASTGLQTASDDPAYLP